MHTVLKAISVSLLVLLPLSGCKTSGTSSHAPGRLSDSVSLKGDASKRLLVQGQEHFADQNFGLAEKHFRKAVEVRADNANAWMGLAASLDQLGRFEFADRAYAQLSEMKGNNPRVLNNIGYSYLLRGDYKKARRYLNKAQKIDPSLEEIEGNIHLLEKIVSS